MARFPTHYEPRPYQQEYHRMWRDKRVGVVVAHRQSGKDVSMSNEMVGRRLKTPKTTGVYVSLDKPMIRDILWDKTYLCPHCEEFILSLQDNTPRELVDWKSTLMEGRFKNKSRLKLDGYFQSGRDKNGVGTSFQDYAFTELALFTREDPLPRLLPIIENEHEPKRLMVASTPRGKRRNPLWQLIQTYKGNREFEVIVRTIDDTNEMMAAAGQPPIISQARLEQIRDTYLKRFGNDRMFLQEYYVDFEEIDAAAVYGEAYMRVIADKRAERFNLDPKLPVYVNFDIGASGLHSDATAWIAWQFTNSGKFLIYDCGEGHGKALPEYVDDLRAKPYYNQIACIILPWDSEHHEKAVNTTPADMMRQKFERRVAVLAKSRQVYKLPGSRQGDYSEITDIQATRMAMYNMVFNASPPDENIGIQGGLWVPASAADPGDDSVGCDWLLECIENFKYEYDNKRQEWTQRPLHDKHSHQADALRYVVQAQKELEFFGGTWYDEQSAGKPKDTSVNYVQDYSGVWG